MNDPEEAEYPSTIVITGNSRIKDILEHWNKNVDTLVVFVRDHHTDPSPSERV